jgi:hypothetical protein
VVDYVKELKNKLLSHLLLSWAVSVSDTIDELASSYSILECRVILLGMMYVCDYKNFFLRAFSEETGSDNIDLYLKKAGLQS